MDLRIHSYAHPDMSTSSLAGLRQDTDRWERYVQPLVGATRACTSTRSEHPPPAPDWHICGALDSASSARSARGASGVRGWLRHQDRVRVDGLALLKQPSNLERFFDPESVVDPVRPR